MLTTAAVHVSALNRADFSTKLQLVVKDMLGSDKYKVTNSALNSRRSIYICYTSDLKQQIIDVYKL